MGLFGGKSNKRAEEAAQRNEAERRSQISGTTTRINQIFDAPARQVQYSDFVNALRERLVGSLNKQKRVADLKSKFAIARSGLAGGSRDVDTKRALGETYAENLLGAEDKAQGALSDLKGRDAAARTSLVGLASGGLDATTAASRAISSMQSNTSAARDNALASGLSDTFGGFSDAYRRQQEAQAFRRGRNTPYGSASEFGE